MCGILVRKKLLQKLLQNFDYFLLKSKKKLKQTEYFIFCQTFEPIIAIESILLKKTHLLLI